MWYEIEPVPADAMESPVTAVVADGKCGSIVRILTIAINLTINYWIRPLLSTPVFQSRVQSTAS